MKAIIFSIQCSLSLPVSFQKEIEAISGSNMSSSCDTWQQMKWEHEGKRCLLPKHHTTKAYRKHRGKPLCIQDLCTRWKWVVNYMLWLVCPWEKKLPVPIREEDGCNPELKQMWWQRKNLNGCWEWTPAIQFTATDIPDWSVVVSK